MASLAAIAELLPGPGEWTEADYYPLSDRGRLVELCDGDIEVLPLPNDFHQLLLGRLFLALNAYVTLHRVGRIRFAPLPVKLWLGTIREPDLMFMSTAHLDRVGKYWGVPDLAVEIVSEGGEARDRKVKRAEYARAGIPEYWIVEPELQTVEVLRLKAETGIYDSPGPLTTADTLTSLTFPGFALSLAELFGPE